MWWMMNETGGNYCSKKSDDLCSNVCDQVYIIHKYFSIIFYFYQMLIFRLCGVDVS